MVNEPMALETFSFGDSFTVTVTESPTARSVIESGVTAMVQSPLCPPFLSNIIAPREPVRGTLPSLRRTNFWLADPSLEIPSRGLIVSSSTVRLA